LFLTENLAGPFSDCDVCGGGVPKPPVGGGGVPKVAHAPHPSVETEPGPRQDRAVNRALRGFSLLALLEAALEVRWRATNGTLRGLGHRPVRRVPGKLLAGS